MNKRIIYWMISLFLIAGLGLISCNDDDDDDNGNGDPQVQERTYTLDPVSDPAIYGTVKFERQNDGSTMVTIDLVGTTSGNSHPSHIHSNSASEGGPIEIDLTDVDGATGMSQTLVTEENDGTPITFDELLIYDGYVNVHLSGSNLSTLVAQGNIGSNSSGTGNNNGGNGGGPSY
ncbi:CHRD domain-containing protein [Echinicola jeungdonensis]|uniref:CHRD domain-containing protein n=1 Tax=Echinicola jeungdonensis TaxID=709343 RepID=A0ABV5J0J2_9BACT|nr:CHRD domain-containing protein [Echinicola jeungdonensis]MDN3667781.1 CHRD domain-containing protein [Echinicola jeungdonensis]